MARYRRLIRGATPLAPTRDTPAFLPMRFYLLRHPPSPRTAHAFVGTPCVGNSLFARGLAYIEEPRSPDWDGPAQRKRLHHRKFAVGPAHSCDPVGELLVDGPTL